MKKMLINYARAIVLSRLLIDFGVVVWLMPAKEKFLLVNSAGYSYKIFAGIYHKSLLRNFTVGTGSMIELGENMNNLNFPAICCIFHNEISSIN